MLVLHGSTLLAADEVISAEFQLRLAFMKH